MFYSTTECGMWVFFLSTSKILYTGEESKPNLSFLHAGTYRFCVIHSCGIVDTKLKKTLQKLWSKGTKKTCLRTRNMFRKANPAHISRIECNGMVWHGMQCWRCTCTVHHGWNGAISVSIHRIQNYANEKKKGKTNLQNRSY